MCLTVNGVVVICETDIQIYIYRRTVLQFLRYVLKNQTWINCSWGKSHAYKTQKAPYLVTTFSLVYLKEKKNHIFSNNKIPLRKKLEKKA